jgi:aryl-alcohol dehydrogenase-like predicted oxidoreductase
MKKRALGRTGLMVSELSLGGFFTSSFGGDFLTSKNAIHTALSLGINLIDTAPNYGDSEEVIGKSLTDYQLKEPVILMTKLGGYPKPFDAQNKAHLMLSVEGSLKKLGRDKIDILMIHEPDRPLQYNWWTDNEKFEGPVIEIMHDLQRQGIIKYIGAAGTTIYEMSNVVRSGKFDLVLTACNYNLLWREAREYVVPEAAKLGMGIVIGSPLQMGALSRRWDDEIAHGAPWMSPLRREQFKRLYKLCDDTGIVLPELAIRYLLDDELLSAILMGPRSKEEVINNVATVDKGPLPRDILKELDLIGEMLPCRPFEEPFVIPFGKKYYGPGLVSGSFI